MAGELVSLLEAREALGRSEKCLWAWRKAGCPGFAKDGGAVLVDLAAVRDWAAAAGRRLGPKARASGRVARGETLTAARRRRELAQARRAEFELQVQRGELLPRAEVEAGRLRSIEIVKAGLKGMAARLSPRLVGLGREEVGAALSVEVDRLIEAYTEGQAIDHEKHEAPLTGAGAAP